ncbi:MAG: polysaccharide biosynthesis tyrosine autokinase [Nitrospira sp.]|nr:polysaccharide biosynthesis tyrosine autokinase [Nitrospira sp.]
MADAYNEEKSKALDKPREYPLTDPSYTFPISQQEEEPHLRDYLHVILRRKWIVITFLIAIVTTVTIGTFMMRSQYKATVTLKIDKENPNILAFKDIVSLERTEEDYYQTQYKTLKSRNLSKRVIRSLGIDQNPEFVQKKEIKETKAEADTLVKPAMLEDESIESGLVDAFIDRIDVNPLQRSRLVNVSFTSHNPELSAKVANTIADSFIALNIESKFEATYKAREWLEKQLEVLKAKVEQAEEKLNQYAAKHEIIYLDEKGKGTESQNIITKKLSEVSTELTQATSDRINKEAIYNAIRSGDYESSSIVMNNPLIQSLKKDYAILDSEYNQQLKIYKPDYPKMVKLKEHKDQIKKKIDAESRKIVTSIKKDFEAAVKRENYLQSVFNAQKKEALSLNERSIQYQILKRESETNKELYNGILQRMKETGVSSTLTASNIQVLDKAEVPKSPSKPRKTLNIMLSIIVGLLGGIGLAFFVEYLDNTVKTPEDVEKKVYLPSLGLVPNYASYNKENLPVEYITHADGKSPIAEAYASIRTFLLLSTGGRPPRVIMVTSPARNEGKTTTVINTAISLTRSNVKVLIIDADMRKPRLHKIFDLDNSPGLSTYLSGNEELGEALIKTTDIPNLDIITSGPTPPNPAELLSSYRFKELIKSLYLYNFIIIDTPPLLGISDPLILSPHADGVVLVIKSGETPKEAAQEARKMLATINAKILGVVLNSIDQSAMRYSHYYNYYRYYYSDENK